LRPFPAFSGFVIHRFSIVAAIAMIIPDRFVILIDSWRTISRRWLSGCRLGCRRAGRAKMPVVALAMGGSAALSAGSGRVAGTWCTRGIVAH
jgi:hypothetical protein